MKETLSYLLRLSILFLLYYLSGVIGLSFEAVGGFATYVWLPTGLSLAFILLYGYRLWPAVFLGALLVNLSQGADFFVGLGIATGNTLEALGGAYLLRYVRFNKAITSYVDVVKLVFWAATVSTLISVLIGVSSLLVGGAIGLPELPQTFIAWWVGDAVSNLVFAPLLLLWIGRSFNLTGIQNKYEFLSLIALSFITGVFFFSGAIGTDVRLLTANFMFPFVIWAAIRFDQKISVLVVVIFSKVAVVYAVLGRGPFGEGSLIENLYILQAFMGISAITSMFLSSAFEERRELEKRKNDFLSMVSHELRTPITTVKAFVQLGQRKLKKNQEENVYFGKIEQQLNRLTGLVNDLLDLSRIERQIFDLEKREFSLNRLVAEVIDEARVNNQGYEITLRGQIKGKLYGDRERIGQVIRNLVSNAIKYSPKKKKILVELSSSHGQVRVSVQDKGIGIPEAGKKGIFNLFYRAVNGEKIPGLGIGLYFSRYIIKEHGGEIWFDSKKNKGTTFYFTLPHNFKV